MTGDSSLLLRLKTDAARSWSGIQFIAIKGDDSRPVSAHILLTKNGNKVTAAFRNFSGVIAIEIKGDEGWSPVGVILNVKDAGSPRGAAEGGKRTTSTEAEKSEEAGRFYYKNIKF